MLIQSFKELHSWQNARILVNEIFNLLSKENRSDYWNFKSQIQRAAISIMNNIAEGFGRIHQNEFIQFLNIALGSACEVSSMLYLALDFQLISEERAQELQGLLTTIQKQIKGLIRYLKSKKGL